jgi:hypothetical protein
VSLPVDRSCRLLVRSLHQTKDFARAPQPLVANTLSQQ